MNDPIQNLSGHGQATLEALRRTHAKVVDQHRQWGEPLVMYRDGKVVLQPVGEELAVAEESSDYRTNTHHKTGESEPDTGETK